MRVRGEPERAPPPFEAGARSMPQQDVAGHRNATKPAWRVTNPGKGKVARAAQLAPAHAGQAIAFIAPQDSSATYSVEVTSPPCARRNSAAWSRCSAENACTTTVVLPAAIASRVAST